MLFLMLIKIVLYNLNIYCVNEIFLFFLYVLVGLGECTQFLDVFPFRDILSLRSVSSQNNCSYLLLRLKKLYHLKLLN